MEIQKVWSPEQLTEFTRDYAVAESGGAISDWNQGSPNTVLAEGFCSVTSEITMDFQNGTRRAIPVALYDGLDFTARPALQSAGSFRFYRTPQFVLEYLGTGYSCLLSNDGVTLSTTVIGGPGGEDLSVSLASYSTVADLVSFLNSFPYEARLGLDGSSPVSAIHHYSGQEIVGETDHRNQPGFALTSLIAPPVPIPLEMRVRLGDYYYATTEAGSIADGIASSGPLAAVAEEAGPDGDMASRAVDTLDGKGTLLSAIGGIEHAINDDPFTGGTEAESDAARAARFQTTVQGLNSGTEFGIKSTLLRKINVLRSVNVLPRYPRSGQVTIVADDGTGLLTTDLVLLIRKILDGDPDDLVNYPGIGTAGITYNLAAPVIILRPITASVTRIGSVSDEDEIRTAVTVAVENYINTRGLGDDFVRSRAVQVMMAAHPSAYNLNLSDPPGDVSVPGDSVIRTSVTSITVLTVPEVP